MKKKEKMVYRIFLMVALFSVLIGGICYCVKAKQSRKEPQGGTLVKDQFKKWEAMVDESGKMHCNQRTNAHDGQNPNGACEGFC